MSDRFCCQHVDRYYFAVSPRRPELLERAVAALRSSFAIAPYENWAHTGGSQGDVQGALSSMPTCSKNLHRQWKRSSLTCLLGVAGSVHWGECSAATSVLFTREQLGDIYVYVGGDGGAPHGVCVNGCTLSALAVESGRSVNLTVDTAFRWPAGAKITAVIDGATTALSVSLNGQACGSFGAAELKRGVQLPAPVPPQ